MMASHEIILFAWIKLDVCDAIPSPWADLKRIFFRIFLTFLTHMYALEDF